MAETDCRAEKLNTLNALQGGKTAREYRTLCGYELPYIGVAMIAFCFFGWCAENIARIITKHIFDCRSQLLPFLFAYGLALLAILVIIGTPSDMRFFKKRIFTKQGKNYRVLSHLTYFAVLFAAIFAGEIAVGEFYEACTGVVLWDYSNVPLHLTKYTSVISCLCYGGGVYLIMAFAFKPMMKLIQKAGRRAAVILCCTLGVAIMLDFVIMVATVFATGNAPVYWSVSF